LAAIARRKLGLAVTVEQLVLSFQWRARDPKSRGAGGQHSTYQVSSGTAKVAANARVGCAEYMERL